jgi:hypothetical protein
MLGMRGAEIMAMRHHGFILSQARVSGHPGSKRPNQKAFRQGTAHFRHNRKLNEFNEKCYERGILGAVRRDYR